jgi:hypothetical protein
VGLDGVEIVMRTEETVGIEIPNEVAAQLLTPAALVEFVARQRAHRLRGVVQTGPAAFGTAAGLPLPGSYMAGKQ